MIATKTVTIPRGGTGFGFSVIGGSDTYLPPMIFTIAPGQPADLSGRVEKGDRIVSVNGSSVANISSKQVIQLINESGSNMVLDLQDDPDLKKRLTAFQQAKARSTSPVGDTTTTTTATSPPRSEAVTSPRSSTTGRRLYQPQYQRLSHGGTKSSESVSSQPRSPPPSSSVPSRTKDSPRDKYVVDHVYNDLDSVRPSPPGGLKQTSLSFLEKDSADVNCYTGGVRVPEDERETDEYEDIGFSDLNDITTDNNITVSPPPPAQFAPHPPPVYAKVNKRGGAGNTPQQADPDTPPALPPVPPSPYGTYEPEQQQDLELPPELPPRETAESCARRLFYQERCVPQDVSFTLASTIPFDEEVAFHYMQYFNFDNYTLDDAVRVFVERAPLIGENSGRERILSHLSKHLFDTNNDLRVQLQTPDNIHTLVCALLMLNTDLHGGMVEKKMSYTQFEANLRNTDVAMIDKALLKDLYNGIKYKPIILNNKPVEEQQPPKPMPKIEQYENMVHKRGPLVKKDFRLSSGKRPGLFKRGWKRFDVELRGSKLTFSKGGSKVEVICHHCLASRFMVHRYRHCVMILQCADERQFLLQARDDTDVQEWMHAINKVAAMFSALPMAAPVSNSRKFQPHSLPMSRTRCSLEEQLNNHMSQVDKLTQEYDTLIKEQNSMITPSVEWHQRKNYLEREKEKFEEYAHLLTQVLYPESEAELKSPSLGRATPNRMSYKRAVQKNVTPVNV